MFGAATSAAAAANAFLDLAKTDTGNPPIDQMKLQKLLFYAHAWHLAIHGKPLFDEDIEAWPWGPVVRAIYTQTAKFGRATVQEPLTKLTLIEGEPPRFVVPQVQDQNLKNFIRSVWDTHKGYTGVQLSNATHGDGEPWTIMLREYGSLDCKPTIPNELIATVFKSKLPSAATNTAA